MRKVENNHTIKMMRMECKRSIPRVAFDYLESGTDKELLLDRNMSQFESIKFIPRFCLGEKSSELKTNFLNQEYSSPIGIAPVGLTGLIWPNAEKYLLQIADENGIVFHLYSLTKS